MSDLPPLFQPLTLRGVTTRNRIAVSPMCQYSAIEGHVTTWHRDHHTALARGGAGIVFVEATAVEARGRITHGDVGLWNDDHIVGLAEIAAVVAGYGAVPAIQIGHAGRKASSQRPWEGNLALTAADESARGDAPWQTVAPSAIPYMGGWHTPAELTDDEITGLIEAFATAARRAVKAGFRAVEIHGAHGYLLHTFLSPKSNRRSDRWGGDLAGRMAFPLAVAEAMRGVMPDDLPLFFRTSSVDGDEGVWSIGDTVALARELKARGVDVMDCSTSGVSGAVTAARVKRQQGFQVPWAAQVRREAAMPTMAVGLILDPDYANAVIADGAADLVAMGRELLHNPFWPLQAAVTLGADPDYARWPDPYGWWLTRRARAGVEGRAPTK